MFAQVLVFVPLKQKISPVLDYRVPEDLTAAVRPGMLVVVPLRTRVLPGIVMTTSEVPSFAETKDIQDVLDTEPALSEDLLDLARWMSRETYAPLHKCVQTMLPPGLRPKAYDMLIPLVSQVPPGIPKSSVQVLSLLLQKGPRRSSQVKRAFGDVDVRRARRFLERRGYIKVEHKLRMPRIQPRTLKYVRLAMPSAMWEQGLQGLRKLDLYNAILSFLNEEDDAVSINVARAETGASDNYFRTLEKRSLISFSRREVIRDPLEGIIYTPDTAPSLTADQRAIWEHLQPRLVPPYHGQAPVLLLGVTGSGKTELYMRAVREALSCGRQALILVPEISLTPQTVQRFIKRFPDQVGLWHSGLKATERFDTWRRIRDGQLSILIGARSALFAPFSNLGVIVLDEEEDHSYKQGRTPFYHARETAIRRARMTGAQVILGSATPSLESYSRALKGEYALMRLPNRVLGNQRRIEDWQRYHSLSRTRYQPLEDGTGAYTIPLPDVSIVDMRAELQAGNRTVFSRTLQNNIDQAMANQAQVILFLNRRGTSTYVFCRDCGWVATCPRCEIPLTYHAEHQHLQCHRCNYQRKMKGICPECGSRRVRAFGLGTQGLQERIMQRWPKARVLRWDRDVAKSHAAHEIIMGRFARGEADILVGTQMIARGLDLPKVTVVGVISADTALNLPDFRAAEQTFQLLAQVAGRAGRGLMGGQVVFQTYHPNHYAVQHAAMHDYEGFAQRELAFRQRTAYPPATRIARFVFAHHDNERAQRNAETLAQKLKATLRQEGLSDQQIIGPAPAFFARVRGRYRWQVILRHIAPADFLRNIVMPAGWVVDIDPLTVL